jgi:homocysteine S-methyltransferase
MGTVPADPNQPLDQVPGASGPERFLAAVARRDTILTEGSLVERLRRDPRFGLHPQVAHTPLLYTPAGRDALVGLWTGYVEVAREAGLPVIVCTPTWRANPERLQRAGLPGVTEVSRDAVALLETVRAAAGDHGPRVFLGALLGCRGDAYLPGEALDVAPAERFHRPQAEALAGAAPDFLLAATLPACTEAVGLARALAATRRPYALSFVLRPSGTLLDGTPLQEAVARIDDAADPPPTFYLGGCVHPVCFERALAVSAAARPGLEERVIGLQGNASRKTPEELERSERLDADEPEAFADAMEAVRQRFGARILGGCCGTDERHIAAVARRAAAWVHAAR